MLDKNLLQEIWRDLENQNQNWFETGFEELDSLIQLPDREGALITIGGRPAMGKTAFVLSMVEKLVKKKKKILMFSLRMNQYSVLKRLLSLFAEVDFMKIKTNNLTPKDWEKLALSLSELSECDLTIDDTSALNIKDIENKIKEEKPEVVFVDYIQLISGKKNEDRITHIENVMINLQRIAKENGVIIFMTSQLSRAVENRLDKRPLLSDLRESGAIENISDVVIFLYRDDYYQKNDTLKKGECEVIIAKNKFGYAGTVHMLFRAAIPKFYSCIKGKDDYVF